VTVEEVKGRIAQLKPDSERVWGKMNPAQALAHCSAAMEMTIGEKKPPRIFIGRLLGRFALGVTDKALGGLSALAANLCPFSRRLR